MSIHEELWNDANFIYKRILEQSEYLNELKDRDISEDRFVELHNSAAFIHNKFLDRFRELNEINSNNK